MRIVIEEVGTGEYRTTMQARRWRWFWHVTCEFPAAKTLPEAVTTLAIYWGKAAEKLGAKLPRRERRRFAKKLAEGLSK